MATLFDVLSCFMFGGMNLARLRLRQYALSFAIATGIFFVAGTLVGIWPNPLFNRVSPISVYEIPLLAAQSLVLGLFLSLEREAYTAKAVLIGTVLALAGIACPLCNQFFILALGWNVLSAHGELLCIFMGAGGVVLSMLALIWRSAQLTFARIANEEIYLP